MVLPRLRGQVDHRSTAAVAAVMVDITKRDYWTRPLMGKYATKDKPDPTFDRNGSEMVHLAANLSRREIYLICDVLHGASIGRPSSATVPYQVGRWIESGIDRHVDAKWKVDGLALANKIRALPENLAWELGRAAREFWALDTDTEPDIALEANLRAVGLVRCAAGHSLCPPRLTCGDCLMVRCGVTDTYDRDTPELMALAIFFSRVEASAICDACNGLLQFPSRDPVLTYGDQLRLTVGDSIQLEDLGGKWGLSPGALYHKLFILPDELYEPLARGVAHFGDQSELDTENALRSTGLVRCPVGHSLPALEDGCSIDTCGACLLARLGGR